jgi:hypothetical protein
MPWPSEDDEFDDDDFDDEDEGDCGLNSDGTCEWIGTEDCDECPYHPA